MVWAQRGELTKAIYLNREKEDGIDVRAAAKCPVLTARRSMVRSESLFSLPQYIAIGAGQAQGEE